MRWEFEVLRAFGDCWIQHADGGLLPVPVAFNERVPFS